MADVKRFVRPAISFVLIGATILGGINVFADNADVRKLGQKVGCGSEDCAVQITREARSPFKQEFTFQVDLETQRTVDVTCKRPYILLGDYECTAPGGPVLPPRASAPKPKPSS